MSEIAKCPHCGKEPISAIFNTTGCVIVSHCGMKAEGKSAIENWNRYAAAMELVEAEVWFKEVLDIKSYIGFDEKNPKSSKNEEYNRIWNESSNDLNNVYERAIAICNSVA